MANSGRERKIRVIIELYEITCVKFLKKRNDIWDMYHGPGKDATKYCYLGKNMCKIKLHLKKKQQQHLAWPLGKEILMTSRTLINTLINYYIKGDYIHWQVNVKLKALQLTYCINLGEQQNWIQKMVRTAMIQRIMMKSILTVAECLVCVRYHFRLFMSMLWFNSYNQNA